MNFMASFRIAVIICNIVVVKTEWMLSDPAQCDALKGNHGWRSGHGWSCFFCKAPLVRNGFSCLSCPVAQHGVEGICTACPQFSTAVSGQNCYCLNSRTLVGSGSNLRCNYLQCSAGSYLDGGSCYACPENTWKDSRNNDGRNGCRVCPVYSVSPIGSTERFACQCKAGFAGKNNLHNQLECTQCSAGTFKPAIKNEECELCPEGSTSLTSSVNIEDCDCKPGYFGVSGGVCFECDAGKYREL